MTDDEIDEICDRAVWDWYERNRDKIMAAGLALLALQVEAYLVKKGLAPADEKPDENEPAAIERVPGQK
jgi:hypothetical protein